MSDEFRGPRVHRPASSATWQHEHRWGTSFGDSTTLRVTRVDGGGLTVAYGRESIEIRGGLVERLAEMVAAAAAWTDEPPPPTGHATTEPAARAAADEESAR